MKTFSFAFLFASTVLGACTTDSQGPTQPGTDELAGETGDGEQAKADGTDNFGFLAVHKDGAFNCSSLLTCAPYSASRVNRSTTQCVDGAYHATCEFKSVDWSKLNLSSDKVDMLEAAIEREANDPSVGTQVLVRGTWHQYIEFSTLEVSEAWIAQKADGNDEGTFVRLADKNIRCITAPCPGFEEGRLNSTRSMMIEGIDFGITAKNSIEDAFEASVNDAVEQPAGVILVGDRTTRSAVSYVERFRTVNQAYLQVK